MKEIIEKLNLIQSTILSEKGGVIYFFGLLERTNTDFENKWDIVISASWIEESNSEADLVYIIENLKKEFDDNLDFLAKIVLLSPQEEFINDICFALQKEETQEQEVHSLKISEEISIKHLFVVSRNFENLKLHEPIEVLSNVRTEAVAF